MSAPEAPDRAGVIAPPPLIFLVTALVGLAVHRVWPTAIVAAPWNRRLAVVGALVSASVLVLAVREFRRARTSVRPDRPTSAIVRTGPFRVSRNPLYVAALLMLAAAALWVNSVAMLLALAPAVVVLRNGVILREERYLEGKFGDEYRAYKRSVRRWL